jgi:hypothetical protein
MMDFPNIDCLSGAAGAGSVTVAAIGKQSRSSAIEPAAGMAPRDHLAAPGKTTLAGELPAADLAANERVLSKDPKYATEDYVGWFSDQIKAKLAAWELPFDPAAVRLATVKLGGSTVQAVVLTWSPAWGSPPVTRDFPLTLTPLDARAAVTAVHALPGWSKVKHNDQGVVTHLLEGEENVLSAASRDHLRPTYKAIKGESEAKQAHAIEGVVHIKHALPSWQPEPMTNEVATFKLSGPTEHKGFAFQGKTADAEEWHAHYSDGVNIKLVAPKAPTHGYHNHTVHDAADAASHMPKSARAVIKLIMLNPVVNPDDAYWAAHYHQPHFHSYMTAGADGIVTIYPDKSSHKLPDKDSQRSAIVHETGHTWSFKHWGQDETKGKWVDWKHAMQADKTSVSGYATSAIAEDVAETIRVYVSTKNTPRHLEYEKIVPHRFKILKKEYDK